MRISRGTPSRDEDRATRRDHFSYTATAVVVAGWALAAIDSRLYSFLDSLFGARVARMSVSERLWEQVGQFRVLRSADIVTESMCSRRQLAQMGCEQHFFADNKSELARKSE
jgi:hypothetical protein